MKKHTHTHFARWCFQIYFCIFNPGSLNKWSNIWRLAYFSKGWLWEKKHQQKVCLFVQLWRAFEFQRPGKAFADLFLGGGEVAPQLLVLLSCHSEVGEAIDVYVYIYSIQETDICHLGKRNISFKSALYFWGENMLVPWRVLVVY